MKQTAVEFLVSHLIEYGFDLSLHKIEIDQAKEMEKQQREDAYKKGKKSSTKTFIEYYKEL